MKFRHIAVISLIAFSPLALNAESDRLKHKLDELDTCIESRERYVAEKQDRIEDLRSRLASEIRRGGADL